MIAAMEQPKETTRRIRLSELFAWLAGHDYPMQVSVRPFCRHHRDTLMNAGSTQNGQTHYYCPKCGESLKVRPRVV
jgi:hypothetical protein